MNQKDIPGTKDFALQPSFQLEQTLHRSAVPDAVFWLGH